MALIPLPPRFTFSNVESFKLQRAGNRLRSRFTGQRQKIIYPFAVWMLSATLSEKDGLDAGRNRSFLVQLEGIGNTFRLPVPGFVRPLNGFSGNPVASAVAAARASSIQVTNLNGPVNEGDFFTVNDELKIATAAVTPVGGSATISFKPRTRKAVAIGTTLMFQNPYCLMEAQDDDVADWSIAPPIRQSGKFEAVEAIDI